MGFCLVFGSTFRFWVSLDNCGVVMRVPRCLMPGGTDGRADGNSPRFYRTSPTLEAAAHISITVRFILLSVCNAFGLSVRLSSKIIEKGEKYSPGPVMFSDTLCPAVQILGT